MNFNTKSKPINVSILNFPDSECDDFVRGEADAKLCHMPAWSNMVDKMHGLKSFYLVAREGSTVCGVLPLVYVPCMIFGKRMISQAFSNYGGPLFKSTAALDALCKRAVELAVKYKCKSLELRNVNPIPCDYYLRTDKNISYLSLRFNPAELWNSFRPQIRNRIRKGEKSGIVVVSGGLELLDSFYRVWTTRMRQLGTPCYPRKLFSSIMETFPDKCQIFVARLNNTNVGGMFTYLFKELVQVRWGASMVKYNNLAPTTYLMWSIANHYSKPKAEYLDFGTSTTGSSQQEFKRRWGTKQTQLFYQYWVPPGQHLTLAKPDNPKYKSKVKIWKKLPLCMTRIVGPYISHHLP